MSTDFTKPVVTDAYATLLPGIVTAINDLAKGLEPTATGSHTSTPTNAIRWNAGTSLWEKYNGTSWAALAATYGINISGSAGSVAWSSVSGRPTALSSFTNDLGNYGGWITSAGTSAACSGNAATATTAANVPGVGQTWQVMGAARVVGTTYTNSTGRPICISVIPLHAAAYDMSGGWINGVQITYFSCGTFPTAATHFLIIPDGATYKITTTSGTLNGGAWNELR
jgi:hypothetical protein